MRAERTLDVTALATPLSSKIHTQFGDDLVAPHVPVDPMYVMPRSRFSVADAPSSSSLANSILAALHRLCPQGAELRTDDNRVKISVVIPGTLDFKIKLFQSDNGRLLVAVRRDSGDWFVFIQLYSALKKYLRTVSGLTIEAAL